MLVDIPKSNAETPHSLGLEAVGPGHTGPVTEAEFVTHGVEVVLDRASESIGVGGIDLGRRLADHVAVKIRDRLADRDRHHDKSDEE